MLEELKSKLRITWIDEDTDLIRMIEKSKSVLNGMVGTSLNFEDDLVVQELLLERCRYVYNNAADEFLVNYADDILRLRLKVAAQLRSEANADI